MSKWTLTDKRKALAIVHFKSQGTLESLAITTEFKCHPDTLSKHLKLHSLSPVDIKRMGLNTMKQDMYNKVYDQENSKDEFNAGMKFLDKYDEVVEDGSVDEDVTTIEDASLQIFVDLGVKNVT